MISFSVASVPVAQPRQRHRIIAGNGRQFVSNYTPTKAPVNAFKAACQLAATTAYQGQPLEGPIKVTIVFVMPRPKALIWKTRDMPRVPSDKKPDIDNLYKSVVDCLNQVIWGDDSQIVEAILRKVVASGSEQPHVEISIWSEVQ